MEKSRKHYYGIFLTWDQVLIVQVQVLSAQVQVQVPEICTRVVLEYKYKYQVTHVWQQLNVHLAPCLG